MALKKVEFTPESGTVDTYVMHCQIRSLGIPSCMVTCGGAVAEWVRTLAWTGDRISGPGGVRTPLRQLRFGILGEVKYTTSPALECVTVVDSTTHSKLPPPIVELAYCPANYNTRQDKIRYAFCSQQRQMCTLF